MTVGYAADKNAIDTRAGSLAVQIRTLLTEDIPLFQAFLAGQTAASLKALGYGDGTNGTVDEISLLKSAFTELAALGQVATGAATAQTATNFLVFSNQLAGVN